MSTLKPRSIGVVVTVAVGIMTLFAGIVGGIYSLDDRFAKAASLRKVDGILQYHLLDVRFTSVRDRLWKLKARHGETCIRTNEDCKDAKNELEDLKRLLNRKRK